MPALHSRISFRNTTMEKTIRIFFLAVLFTGCSNQQELDKITLRNQQLEKELVSIRNDLADLNAQNAELLKSYSENYESITLQNQIFFQSVVRGLYLPNIQLVDGKNVMLLDKFIQYLQNLEIFSEEYLADRRGFFRQCQLDIQNLDEGADIGEIRDLSSCEFYDYNLYMRTQEPADHFLTRSLEINNDFASAELEFYHLDQSERLMIGTYLSVTYKNQNGRWLIHEVTTRKKSS